ncbi:hypothetical protein ACFQ07_32170, partial [Actinomadura adrarensis]
ARWRATLERARDLLDGDLAWKERDTYGRPAEFAHASTAWRDGEPRVEIELKDYKRNERMDQVRISHLDHEQVLMIVEAVANMIAAKKAA